MSESQTTYPITASEGRDNAFYHHCQPVEHNSPYASCLNKLKMHAQGKLPPLYSECKTAIQSGKCVAEGMREQEIGKGVALYYIPRAEVRAAAEAREALAAEKMSKMDGKGGKESKRKSKMGIDSVQYSSAPMRQQPVRHEHARPEVGRATMREAAFDMSAAMARVITEEAAKVNDVANAKVTEPKLTPAKVEVKVAKQESSQNGKKSMIEIAREMAAKRKAEQATL